MKYLSAVVLFFLGNIAFGQGDYTALKDHFSFLELPFDTPLDYFPVAGYDDRYGVELEFEANPTLLMNEVTTLFSEKYTGFEKGVRYYSVGKVEVSVVKGLLVYAVVRNPADGGLEGHYELILFAGDHTKVLVVGQAASRYYDRNDRYFVHDFSETTRIEEIEDHLVLTSEISKVDRIRTEESMEVIKEVITREKYFVDDALQVEIQFSPRMMER